jgi:CheY-like chemotaxis protein
VARDTALGAGGVVVNSQQSQLVLIADDDHDIRQTLRDLLTSEGYTTQEAVDGVEAVDALLLCPDHVVVLLDLRMPYLSGWEVLTFIQSDGTLADRHAYIIITANRDLLAHQIDDNPGLAILLHRHAIPIIDKPFDVEDVLRTVAEATSRLLATVPTKTETDQA